MRNQFTTKINAQVEPRKLFAGIQQAAKEAEATDDPRVWHLAVDAMLRLIPQLSAMRGGKN